MKNFRALDLAIQYYALVENIKLPHHLREQLLRSASSVSLNLSEGNAKLSYADKKRIYQIALGSFRESQTILKLGRYDNGELNRLADHLGACLYKLTTFQTPAKLKDK
ncbi:MAG: four helix bundle protein [Bdellovibrionota bacterium]